MQDILELGQLLFPVDGVLRPEVVQVVPVEVEVVQAVPPSFCLPAEKCSKQSTFDAHRSVRHLAPVALEANCERYNKNSVKDF